MCSGYSEKDASADTPVIVIETEYGVIRIKPYTAAAPRCADLVLRLAKTSACAGCNFYRHEHVPKVGTAPHLVVLTVTSAVYAATHGVTLRICLSPGCCCRRTGACKASTGLPTPCCRAA